MARKMTDDHEEKGAKKRRGPKEERIREHMSNIDKRIMREEHAGKSGKSRKRRKNCMQYKVEMSKRAIRRKRMPRERKGTKGKNTGES